MKLKFIQEEDFTNYHKAAMFIALPYCDFKCEKECGIKCCQNSSLVTANTIDIPISVIVNKYLNNKFTSSIVIGGLEPFKSFDEMLELVKQLRLKTADDIVIYTGYYENEILDELQMLKKYKNIIVKFGRFRPNSMSHIDPILGVKLMNPEQYAKKIS